MFGRKKKAKERVIKTKVVGVTFKNDDGSDRQKILKKCRRGEKLVLKNVPAGGHANAVAVLKKNGKQLGNLSRELADDIASKLRAGKRVTCVVLETTGGGLFSRKTRGCNIEIRIGK